MPGLGEETIKKVLRDSGLTEKEADLYIFLAKHEAMKGTEIAQLTNKDKAHACCWIRFYFNNLPVKSVSKVSLFDHVFAQTT